MKILSLWSCVLVQAFDIVTVSHKKEEIIIDLEATCPCDTEELPCFDSTAGEGEQICKSPIFTATEVAQAAANGQTLLRCGTLVDCIELKLVTETQQQSLVPRQLLQRSRLSQFKFETAPVDDAYGIPTTQKNTIDYSRWTYIGCFSAQDGDITADATTSPPAQAYDPNDCIDVCTGPGGLTRSEYYEQQKNVVIGISGLSCACVVENMAAFIEITGTATIAEQCNIPCLPSFSNTLCGGDGDVATNNWGLFMEYEYQSYGSSGAYDVWRYMWYTVVVIKDSTIRVGAQGQAVSSAVVINPERYYLHCTNEQGLAVFQNQVEVDDYLLYGLAYDITGSRLVALAVPASIGRTPVITQNADDKWSYKVVSIEIDESDPMYPRLTQNPLELNDENLQSMSGLYKSSSVAQDNFVFTGASTIISRAEFRSYAVTAVEKSNTRVDRFFLFSLIEEEGVRTLSRVKLIYQQNLGFKGLQIFGDTRQGTISAVGPINGDMMYVVLGYLFRDSNGSPRWHSYYDESNRSTGRYWAQSKIRTFHVYPGGGTSAPRNNTFMSYRNYPEAVSAPRPRLETAYSVMQINAYSGNSEKWCQVEACETGDLHRSIDPDVPYANLFNAEAGFPLSLSAPKVEHARFTIEGLFLKIVWNMETTRGGIPIDTDADRVPDRIDPAKDRSGGAKFDCGEVLAAETVALIGEYPGTACTWKDDTTAGETLEVEFGPDSQLRLGHEIAVLANKVFAKPICGTPGDFSTCEFSPAAVGEGAIVSLPDPLLPPIVVVEPTDGTFSIDECSSIELRADETKRTGGSAEYLWELDDSDGVPYTSLNTVSTAMNATQYALLQERLASTTSGKLFICVECMPQGFRYKMKVTVTSRWLLPATLSFVVEKADYPAPTIRTGSWSSPTVRVTSQALRIETEIRQSSCAVGNQQLACEWNCASHNPDFTLKGTTTTMPCDNSLFDAEKLQFPVQGQVLVIPRYTLSPPAYSSDDQTAGITKYHEFTFQILCVVVQSATDVIQTGDPAQASAQNAAENVIIRIERSGLKVLLYPAGTEFPQKATTMALNARFTMDPDMEEVYSCLLNPGSLACDTLPMFEGDFTFRCWKVTPVLQGGSALAEGVTECDTGKYVVRDINSVCPTGFEVASATDCEEAATLCGSTWNSFDANSPAELSGCFQRTIENDIQFNSFTPNALTDGAADRKPICLNDAVASTSTDTTTRLGTTQMTSTGTQMSPCFTLGLGPGANPNFLYQVFNGEIDDWKLKNYDPTEICTRRGGEDIPKLDIGYNVRIDQVSFTQGDSTATPPVLPQCYCYYEEGLLLVETNKMELSVRDQFYSFQVNALHQDGRVGQDIADVYIVDRLVLQVFLKEIRTDEDLAQLPLTSVYQDVTLEGTISKDPNFDGAVYTFRWEIFKKQSGGNEFVTEWKNETDTFTWNDPAIIEWDPVTTSRITFHLDPNSFETPLSTQLQRSTNYKIMLHVTATVLSGQYEGTYYGKAQKIVNTAPGPPIRGGFVIKPAVYTFPDDLLTNEQFSRIPHTSQTMFAFDAPQWRADSSLSGGTADSELTYSFGFTPVSATGQASATIWQVEGQASTHFEVVASKITYDGQDSLIANLQVCTVYKVCASTSVTLAMDYNVDSTYEEVRAALLPEETDPQQLIAAQTTVEGIKTKLTTGQYDELQTDFRNSVKRFNFGAMDSADLGSALQATAQATDSISGMTDPAAKNAEISDLLDATGEGLDAFLTNPDPSNAAALVNVFSNILAGTSGQGDSAGVGRRYTFFLLLVLELIRRLHEYEEEFGEDLLETLEKHEAFPQVASAEGDSTAYPSSGKLLEATEDLKTASPEQLRKLHAELAQVLTPEELAVVFAGTLNDRNVKIGFSKDGEHLAKVGDYDDELHKLNQHPSASLESRVEHGPSVGLGGRRQLSEEGKTLVKRISEQYGRRFSRREFEKRLRILKELDKLGYYIPVKVSDGVSTKTAIWKKFRQPTPAVLHPQTGLPRYLVSSEQMRALETKERVNGEFGSTLATHRARRPVGQNHEQPGPRDLHVYVRKGDGHGSEDPFTTPKCDFCGVYHTPLPRRNEVGDFEPYSQYTESDMKYLTEKTNVADGSTRPFTLVWNKTAAVYQIVEVKRRKIVAQSVNTAMMSEGIAGVSFDPRRLMASEGGVQGGHSSSSSGPSSIFGHLAGQHDSSVDAETHRRRLSAAVGGPILLRDPSVLEWSPEHIAIKPLPQVITNCESSFCDNLGLYCHTRSQRARDVGGPVWGKEKVRYQCCAEKNPQTLCNKPPCWHEQRCPRSSEEIRQELQLKQKRDLRALRAEMAASRSRRTSHASISDMFSGTLSSTSSAEKARSKEARMRRLEDAMIREQVEAFNDTTSSNGRVVNNWFTRWMEDEYTRNTTVGRMWKRLNFTEANAPFSFADRARAYELYHSSDHRRLQMATNLQADMSMSDLQTISFVEKLELPFLNEARRQQLQKDIQLQSALLEDAKQEIQYNALDPAQMATERANDLAAIEQERRINMDTRRNISQALTRLSIYRDRLVRAMIPSLVTNARTPLHFDTSMFQMDVGKVTNMSAVSAAFVFPSEFIVPADSPDEPTLTNNVTALAYQFVQYKENIYYWSPSNPSNQESAVITLLMFYASAQQYPVCVEGPGCNVKNEFIRVFADYSVYSSGICMIWDRFFENTAGGAWNGRDIVNDGNGCLTLTLGDIGFFVDGRPSYIFSLTEASTFPLSTLVSRTKLSTLATMVMLLLLNWFLIFWGYKHDEKVRSDQRAGIIPYTAFHYDGDGINTPQNANDPIAYKFADSRNQLFLKTYWNVLKREHMAVAPVFYHETFTRPQRLLCTMGLIQGIMAINAMVYGIPNKFASSEQFVISGILSALLMFPVYCVFLMMFTARPMPAKRRMIKKRQVARELDMINAEKEKLIAESQMLPENAVPSLPIGGMSQQQESMALLALPPPIAGGPGGGAGGMLALGNGPAGGFSQPPAPKYPPPPGYAKALPPPQDLLPPIYFGRAGMPQLPALPSFTPQAKAQTPPQTAAALQGMRAITPRGKAPMPPPAMLEEGAHNMTPDSVGSGSSTPMAGGGMFEPKTPTLPPPSTRGFMPGTPKGMPPVIPFGTMRPDTMIQRGQPPTFHQAPFKMPPPPGMARGPGMPGPGQAMELALYGSSPAGGLPTPGAMSGLMTPGPISPGVPLPPPPPREDDSAFVRRVRLIYMDRVMREHQKQELLELDAVGRPIPNMIFNLSAVMPYLMCAAFILASLIVVLVYALKFDAWQEEHWYYANIIGFCMVVFLLDVIRSAVITIVELRKFEIRKRSRAGDFVVRKVQKQDDKDGIPAILKPKPKTKAKPTAAVPKIAPKFSNMERPRFLPEPELASTGGPGQDRPTGPSVPGNRTPPGVRTPPGAKTPPRIPFGVPSPGGGRPPMGDTSPAGSHHSNISQSLSQSLAARRDGGQVTPPGGPKPPPPPPMMGPGPPRPPAPPGTPPA
eukprot:g11253.t1